jgi:hypothetical protein
MNGLPGVTHALASRFASLLSRTLPEQNEVHLLTCCFWAKGKSNS